MVQRVWTGWDKALLNTILGVDLVLAASAGVGLVPTAVVPTAAVLEKRREVEFRGQFPATNAQSSAMGSHEIIRV